MGGKGRGWHGDSRLHSLARKGISTNIDKNRRFDVSNFVSRGNLNLKDFPPQQMVGDGKLPNMYWVTASNYYYIFDPIQLEFVGVDEIDQDLLDDKDKNFKMESKTLRVFSSYEEAKKFAEETFDHNENVTIEDRLSGQIYESLKYRKQEWDDFYDVREDTRFTKEAMEKQGVEFK